MRVILQISFLTILFFSCQQRETPTLFTQISGIGFVNKVANTDQLDVFRYRNFYNGGGVSIGDVNGDNLPDIYLSSNLDSNRLYINKGNWEFEDATRSSGTWGMRAWSTGVTMVDINGDRLLDIYVCNAGNASGDDRENELFINNGNLTFTEKAESYGLADNGWSTHAGFFDYDLDGDLDCYVLNNSFRSVNSFDQYKNIRSTRHAFGGDRLYRNDGDSFVDVSEEAGIYGSEIAFGLGIALADFNLDGWTDIYVSNDFFERDYFYINNQDGTFSESLEKYLNHTSQFSMGTDAADLNNDGLTELYITDMLPESDYRLKTATSFMSNDVKEARLKNDYYHQYMRNSLQLNNGDGTFSEVGLFSETAATDWSWGAIIADYDNSGVKEIFVTNGIARDVINQDFLMGFQETANRIIAGGNVDFKSIVDQMPEVPLSNYMFKKDSVRFVYSNVSPDWGLDELSFSNGAAYGDLDNDGDLDLVVNNLNQPVSLYKNNSETITSNGFLKVEFHSGTKNSFGIGAKVWLHKGEEIKFYENYPIRGFQSSMDYVANIGLGDWDEIDKIVIEWPGGGKEIIHDVQINQRVTLDQRNADFSSQVISEVDKKTFLKETQLIPEYTHRENLFVDFNYDRLLLHMNSRNGPALSVADVNGDGLEDIYLGGAMGQEGSLYLQNGKGGFLKSFQKTFEYDGGYEDVASVFFDADGDGDKDLYVVSGGSERGRGVSYQDRLYLNERTVFRRFDDALPKREYSGSCVEIADYDNDGDLDLFVGTRLDPYYYGMPVTSMLLENNGTGKFKDVTVDKIPQVQLLGMVTDAEWTDYDSDGLIDLVVVGEWMPLTIFRNRGSGFQKMSSIQGLEGSSGYWNTIEAMDINGDGYEDLFAGNLGLNSRFKG